MKPLNIRKKLQPQNLAYIKLKSENNKPVKAEHILVFT